MKEESKSSYRQILKATFIFGGMQFFNVFIALLRTKLIALFMGPTGMGIMGLLQSSLNTVGSISGFGIESSAIKHISQQDDHAKVSQTIAVVKRLSLWLGLLGCFLVILFSDLLSRLSFGDSAYGYMFVYLSSSLLLKQLTISHLVVFQGMRKIKILAKANFYGSLVGFLGSVPLYYIYRIDAIVPSMLFMAVASYFVAFLSSRGLKIDKIKLSFSEVTRQGRGILGLGLIFALSGLFSLLSSYIIQIYIGKMGGLDEVGRYTAGITLLNSYVGIVFTLMSTDYFPKLSSISQDNQLVRQSVREQSFMSVFIMTPIVVFFLIFAEVIVKTLYSSKFLSIVPLLCFGIIGMLFRAVSWTMGFIVIAKGDMKLFLRSELGFTLLSLLLNMGAYPLYGLQGLGISFMIYNLVYLVFLKIITKRRYDFYFERDFLYTYLICISFSLTAFGMRNLPNQFPIKMVMLLGILVYVLWQLNKKIKFKELLSKYQYSNDK